MSTTVVITGASTGIGRAITRMLDHEGWVVFAGVRRQTDADSLVDELSERVKPIILDVTDPHQIESAVAFVEASLDGSGLDALVNNAGIAVGGPLEYIPVERLRLQFEVNVIGPFAMTQAFLPLLRQNRGRIVNMSSISGRFAAPLVGPYAMSKHALEAYSDSLRRELLEWGIEVSLIEPGVIATPIWEKAKDTASERRKLMTTEAHERYGRHIDRVESRIDAALANALPPEKVAEAVRHAVTAERPKTRYLVGKDARWIARFARWMPDRRLDKMIARRGGD